MEIEHVADVMKCPNCDSAETRVTKSWVFGSRVQRIRRCEACGSTGETEEESVGRWARAVTSPAQGCPDVTTAGEKSTAVAIGPQTGGKGGDPGSSLELFSGSPPDASLISSSDRQDDEAWPPDFAAFLAAYPAHKRKKKSDALRAWKRRRPPLAKVLAALAWQVRSHDWTKERGQFVPLPASYINGGGWMDEKAEPPAAEPRLHPKDEIYIDAVRKPFPGRKATP